jgi:hypothetical protein
MVANDMGTQKETAAIPGRPLQMNAFKLAGLMKNRLFIHGDYKTKHGGPGKDMQRKQKRDEKWRLYPKNCIVNRPT